MEIKLDKFFYNILIAALLMLSAILYYNYTVNKKITINNDEISQLKKIHEQELKSLNDALLEERRKNDEALKLLKFQVDSIDQFYQKRIENLEKSKAFKKADLSKNATLDSLANDLLKVMK
jgi:hypothetical protein